MNSVKNSVQLIGHMGIDPEVRTLESGVKVARIRMATTERFKAKNGSWMDETTWHNIVAWETLAEKIEKQLKKSDFVLIEGKLTSRTYTDAKGQKKYVYEVRATNFMLLDKKEAGIAPAAEVAEEQMPF